MSKEPDTVIGAINALGQKLIPPPNPPSPSTSTKPQPFLGLTGRFETNDILETNVHTSIANLGLGVVLSVLYDGSTQTQLIDATNGLQNPTNDRSSVKYDYTFGVGGYIRSVVIGSSTVSPRGATYVQVYLKSSQKSSIGAFNAMLVSNYSDVGNPYWPGGKFESSQEGPGYVYSPAPASPAAGADISITVPTNARWRVRGLAFKFVTSSTSATRQSQIQFEDAAGKTFFRTGVAAASGTLAQFATLSQTVGFIGSTDTRRIAVTALSGTAALVQNDATVSTTINPLYTNGDFNVTLPDIILPVGFKIVTNTKSIQAGDQWTIDSFVVEEWIDI